MKQKRIADTHYFLDNFPSKADTLKKLKSLLKKSVIEKESIFTVTQWEEDEASVIAKNAELFKDSTAITVRSSSRGEDTMNSSGAGKEKRRNDKVRY